MYKAKQEKEKICYIFCNIMFPTLNFVRELTKLKHILNLILTVIIIFILGIPLGKWLIDAMVSQMGDSFDMITAIHPSNILLSCIIAFTLSYLVNLMFSRKIKRLDMVGSLKGVE
jgi:undecaprenyl pyrophosphate phosphatase UppP